MLPYYGFIIQNPSDQTLTVKRTYNEFKGAKLQKRNRTGDREATLVIKPKSMNSCFVKIANVTADFTITPKGDDCNWS